MNKSLTELIDDFVNYKRHNGYVYVSAEYHLMKYAEYISVNYPDENVPSKTSINSFLNEHSHTPGTLYNLATFLREFSRYLISIGYTDAYIIPYKKIPLPTPVQPYLFTEAEISRFFMACDSMPYDCHAPKRNIVFPAMYRLMYCCGLRCKEARKLKCENVVLNCNYIDILQSKGPKSRRIFISDELSHYLDSYNESINRLLPDRVYFFPSRGDSPYSSGSVEKTFLKIWYTAFPEKRGNGVSIRAYDFRHHFAYANMNRWLKEGKDVNAMLPYLMRYMGHQDIESTLYYFHLVPEIYREIIEKSSFFEDLLPEVTNNDQE